jgi:hypothetical protein
VIPAETLAPRADGSSSRWGEGEDTNEGEMNGVAFQYTSLGASGYRDEIERAGMRLNASHYDEWDNYVYVAEKSL